MILVAFMASTICAPLSSAFAWWGNNNTPWGNNGWGGAPWSNNNGGTNLVRHLSVVALEQSKLAAWAFSLHEKR